ncbi:hypothetical protein [Pseudanabaena sp. PCC 6802]|uniref:hypothetical protein n=1 Tax=Pseudanabaena sp. PCC 6802 TaxID=118173 RepID=UPI0003469309|nr:hypothetical protein [Pseudanabaena sp. PCC 6802]
MSQQQSSKFNAALAKTRLLLGLWDMGAQGVKKGDLMRQIVKSGEKSKDYQVILDNLSQENAILIATEKRATRISITAYGQEVLASGLKDENFSFGKNQVGSSVANALLKWIRHLGDALPGAGNQIGDRQTNAVAIATYDEFKALALEVYDRLNRDYNYDRLVPIYRIRREIGDRVTRSQFNDWMLEMQTNDIFQLQGGALEDGATDKLEDSIMTKVGGMRCYAKILTQSH